MVKKVEELNFARVMAMLAVIMIHVTSTFINASSNFQLLGMNLGFILNQAARFAVPLFVLLSGVSLNFSSYTGALRFYRKRLVKIGIPYFLWTVLYYVYNRLDILPRILSGELPWWGTFKQCLLLGQAASHLYFIVIIFQCYLAYPLLRKLAKKAPASGMLVMFAITFGVQKLYYFRRNGLDLIPDGIRPYLWELLPTWIAYFYFGMLITPERVDALRKLAVKYRGVILTGTVLYAAVYTVESRVTGDYESIKPMLNVYTVLALLSAFALWNVIGRAEWVRKSVDFLARHSMTVYFGHLFVLTYFRRIPFFVSSMRGMILLYIAVTVISCILAGLLDTALEKGKKLLFRRGRQAAP